MAEGLASYDNAGNYTFYSPSMSSNFFDTAIQTSAGTTLGNAAFQSAGSIVTPLGLSSWTYGATYPNYGFTIPGGVNSGGTTYYAPTMQLITGIAGFQPFYVSSNMSVDVQRFGKLAAPLTGYGFSCQASDGLLAISQDYNSYYLHPNSASAKLRTGTASSNATGLYGSSIYEPVNSYNQSLTQNITFDYPMTRPPLIFITASSGPISLNGMIRNANGKFIGASICASPTYSMISADFGGYWAAAAASRTFTYFIVSQEEPLYGAVPAYGLEVYNSLNSRVFSSRHFIPPVTKTTITLPYMALNGPLDRGTWVYGPTYQSNSSSNISKTTNQGVCINSFHSITGAVGYVYYYYIGPLTLAGRYIHVTDSNVAVSGLATSSIMATYPSQPGLTNSVDFLRASTSTMDVFFARYQF